MKLVTTLLVVITFIDGCISLIQPSINSYTTPSSVFTPSADNIAYADGQATSRSTTNDLLLLEDDVSTTLGAIATLSQLGASEKDFVDQARYRNDIAYDHTKSLGDAEKSTFLNEEANEIDLTSTGISYPDCSSCSAQSRFRDITGKCNNVDNCVWGSAPITLRRILSPEYSDNNAPRDSSLGPFEVKEQVFSNTEMFSRLNLSAMTMQFGQYVAHDLAASAGASLFNGNNEVVDLNCCAHPTYGECVSFSSSSTCHNFIRSAPGLIDRNKKYSYGEREQINTATAFIDASPVYGSNAETETKLRKTGTPYLNTWDENDSEYPPTDPNVYCHGYGLDADGNMNPCMIAGDTRPNVHFGMAIIHALLLKEHNRIAREIETIVADKGLSWDSEKVYQETKRILGAILQVITYQEYLPKILGSNFMTIYGLDVTSRSTYSPNSDPSIINSFTTAAFRFGHSQIYKEFKMANKGTGELTNELSLSRSYFNNDKFYTQGDTALGRYLLGLLYQRTFEVDGNFADELLEPNLFKSKYWRNRPTEGHLRYGSDLAATNILRGRDHGLPNYQKWLDYIGQVDTSSVEYLSGADLTPYGDAENVDLYAGGLLESHVPQGAVGRTFAHIIALQFKRLKDGDRYFFSHNNVDAAHMWSDDQVTELKKVKLSQLLCLSGALSTRNNILPDAFQIESTTNARETCESVSSTYPSIEVLISDQL